MKLPSVEEVSGFGVGVIVGAGIGLMVAAFNWPTKQTPETKPCECLSLETTLLYVAKTEMWVDSLRIAKKGQRNRLIDSINYYRAKLEMDGNVIEY